MWRGEIQKTCWKAEISTLPLCFANRDLSTQSFHPRSHSESHQAAGHTCSASLSGLACAPASLPLFCIPSFLPASVWHSGLILPQRHFPSAGHPWALLTKNWDLQVSQGGLKAFAEVGSPCFTRHSSTPQHSPSIYQQSSSERCLPRLRLIFGLLGWWPCLETVIPFL